jgi:hypothetical protein
MMKKTALLSILLVVPSILYAHKSELRPTTFAMSCFIISPDDKWSYRDYGFKLTYHDIHGMKKTISAQSTGAKKNCTDKTVLATAKIPAGTLEFQINDFTGELGSTIECTNTIKYKLTKDQIGKICQFMVKTEKYGSYTSTDTCALQMNCDTETK